MEKGYSTKPGFINPKGQINVRNLAIDGTDHYQTLYQLACSLCGHNYAANGSDIHERRCPACQQGRDSTGGWTYPGTSPNDD